MLDVALRNLMRGRAQQLLAQHRRFGVERRSRILELIANAERAARGDKRIDETMGSVHIAERHRSIPAELVAAGMEATDPTDRVLEMLEARTKFLPTTADFS